MPSCSDCCAFVLAIPVGLLWIVLSLGVLLPIVLAILIVSLVFTLVGLFLSCICVEGVAKGFMYVSDFLDKVAWKLYDLTVCGQACNDESNNRNARAQRTSSQESRNRNAVTPRSTQRPTENRSNSTTRQQRSVPSANNTPVAPRPAPTTNRTPAQTSAPTPTNEYRAATITPASKENVVIDMPPLTAPSAPPVPLATPPPAITVGISHNGFTYGDLVKATGKFSDENFLGEGGMASVHKGTLADGREVAVKQLKIPDSKWGEREFAAEVSVLGRVNHRHLVQLIGCYTTKGKRALVCEYVPNKTLEFHLHGENQHVLDWPTRLKISLGAARGLAYLHEECQPRIVHRDIKAANILIDNSFDAKVADFGLAKFLPAGDTHIYATYILGTHGLPLAEALLDDGNYDALVDPRLENNYDRGEMRRMVACASACVRWSPQYRPPMTQVVLVLGGLASPDTLRHEDREA
ncbi:proline-rich receptor-like protein kinase PERK7 [Ananas comosus]|uniref:non-specific serine/threonine protein kinase n=1 Tax=Ananas comosus TaxID=4615 RepID=A0A6P5FXP5_ANACO|nr:proline-rich receptor-like protein kinase PERK7 [Ananas comosus]